MLQRLWENFKEADKIYEQKLKGRFMNVVIANMWRRRRKRWGGDQFYINLNVCRRYYTFFTNCEIEARRARALEVVKPFLLNNYHVELRRQIVRKFYFDITFI